MKIAAILVAAGAGRRAGGDIAKQWVALAGKPMAQWSLDTLTAHPLIETVVAVAPSADLATAETILAAADACVAGGDTRSQSVRNGLAALDSTITHVMIHDAARPGLSVTVLDTLAQALKRYGAAAPALPVVDALKRKTATGLSTVDREALYRVQTPQVFQRSLIESALSDASADYVDDLAAVEALGTQVHLVEGDEALFKVTLPGDFARMEQILMEQRAPRMGSGFDVHAFAPGDSVALCGVRIPHDATLAGHSDADVGWHALTDAILGALALGDIGDHFPPSDPQWKGASSIVFLRHAVALADEAGYRISNCDLTLICEAPKVKPHRQAMRAATAAVLQVDVDQVSIKATTTEGLGFTGRREGIAAQAVAVLAPLPGKDKT